MTNTAIYVTIGLVAVAGTVLHYLLVMRPRHRRDHREHLEPILAEHGLEFVSAVYPGMFKVGPFPKIEAESGRPQTRVAGVRGEYGEYRIVTVQDASGAVHEVWALLEFEMFHLRRVRWRAAQGAKIPDEMQGLLET